jgi:hypothetical protein
MKEQFNSSRNAAAAAYFNSQAFLDALKTAAKRELVQEGRDHAVICTDMSVKPQDMPYIRAAFLELKKEYPELDHIRLNTGLAAGLGVFHSTSYGRLVIDTKKNGPVRRFTARTPVPSFGWGWGC